MRHHIVIVGLLAGVAQSQAFAVAPISLGGLPGKVFVRAPNTFPTAGSVSQENMATGHSYGNILTNDIPHFTAKPDKSISWDAMDWCLEASGANNGDVVRISHCTGVPAQKWNWMPLVRGRSRQIQLVGTLKCLHAVGNHDYFDGEVAELRECGGQLANTWKLEETLPHHATYSSSMRHMMFCFVFVATLWAFGLHAWLRRWYIKPHKVSASQLGFPLSKDHGGICLTAPLATHNEGAPSTLTFDMSAESMVPVVMTVSTTSHAAGVPTAAIVPMKTLPTPMVKNLAQAAPTELPTPAETPDGTGSLIGAICLVAGSAVGAGMLALPARTFDAGFAPSVATILLCWFFMIASGLLLAEVNVNTLCTTDKSAVSLDAMAEETLGKFGARVTGVAFTLLQFALLSAYMIQGGNVLFGYLDPVFDPSATLPTMCGPLLFALVAGGAIYAGSEKQVENANNILFGGMLATFGVLLTLGVPQVDASLLERSDMNAMVPAVPLVICTLVFHNVIPTVCQQLRCDVNKIRTALVVGSGIPMLMFVLWIFVVLGSVSPDVAAAAAQSATGVFDPLEALGASSNSFGAFLSAFSLFAILTSFIGTVLGMVDYFADAFAQPLRVSSNSPTANADGKNRATISMVATSMPLQTSLSRLGLFAATLVPPLAVALYDPSLFFAVLDTSGLYGDLFLFGIIPGLMAWKQRYGCRDDPYTDANAESLTPPMLPGGRLALSLIVGSAAAVIMFETYERLSAFVG